MAARWIGVPLSSIGRFLFRHGFVRVYRLLLTERRFFRRLVGSSKNRVIFLLANRYAVHIMVALLALGVSATSVYARDTELTDTGDKTLLFAALATGESYDSATVEDKTAPVFELTGINYLGNDVLRPGANYDFDSEPVLPSENGNVVGGGAVVAPTTTGAPGKSVAPREGAVEYVVEEGDTIGSIATDYQISVQTILWANNIGPRDYLRIGQKLKIPPVDGVIHTVKAGDTIQKIAQKYGADADEILAVNRLGDGAGLRVGEEIMVPGGEPPAAPKVVAKASRPIASLGSIFAPPPANPNRSTRLLWPTSGHRITQYYGGWECVRGCRVHTGLDVDGDYSSPLYAAEDGIVIVAGWGGGYGYHVDIDHGGGLMTRYGHASKLFVKPGEYVKRGQTIAMMGSTGFSTGTHVHFEVRINGRPVNPISYLR